MNKINNKIIRRGIDDLTAYVPGKPIDLVKRQYGIKDVVKLASNENAFGVSKKARKAILSGIKDVFRYPDGSCYYLKKALAKKLGVLENNIIFGNGSDEIIDVIIKSFLNPQEEILTSGTTFVEYEIVAKANGFKAKTVPLKDFRYDLEALRRNITSKTKVIFIANPNNPTGTYVTDKELADFTRKIPKDKLVVVDEAYQEFSQAGDFPRLLKNINSQNSIILRTFSKAYGLAGLRVGYALACSEFIAAMERVRQPFNVNILAQKAAEAVLGDNDFLKKTKIGISKEKKKMYSQFKAMGIEYIPSEANFIMFKTQKDGVELCLELLKRGVIIRDLKQYALDKYVRVTIGTEKENKKFIQELKNCI